MQSAGEVNNANISNMAALLDHADSDGLLHIRFQKSRRRCTSSAALESTGDRVTAAPDGMSQTTQRAVLPAEEESQRERASDTP